MRGEDGLLTDGNPLFPALLLVEVKLIGLKGDPSSSADSVVGEDRILFSSILLCAHVDNTKVVHDCDVVGLRLRSCSVGDKRELGSLLVHAFRVVVKPDDVAIDQH